MCGLSQLTRSRALQLAHLEASVEEWKYEGLDLVKNRKQALYAIFLRRVTSRTFETSRTLEGVCKRAEAFGYKSRAASRATSQHW